jgi:hypothetical protein
VERCELRFKLVGEKPVFKLHLQVETWFWKVFRGACNWFWNVFLWKDTQVWENDVLVIMGLQAYNISNFKVLEKQSFSICFPPASCFM